jgi:cardiolipin synthase
VSVEILLPGPHGDKRFVQLAGQSVYEELLTHGIRIWHFQPSMLHAKVMTVDRQVASIGSANFNARSIELDEEINLVALDRPLVRLLDDQFDEDLERSEEIDPSRWEERSLTRRALVGLTKPLRHSV